MAATKNATTIASEEPREVLSLAEASARYEGEWVLFQATQVDERQRITHGEVLDHNKDRKQISKTLKTFWRREPRARIWIFLGGMKTGTGEELYEELRRGLERAAKEEYVNVKW
jgi:hypothetical protein